MPRLSGVTIPDNKRIVIALTYVQGIGKTSSEKILKEAGIDPNRKASDLSLEDLNKVRDVIEKNYTTEGELRREWITNIRRLRDIGSWRGQRHAKRLPSRGQRTKTNTRTVRGNKRQTMGSGRKPPPSAT